MNTPYLKVSLVLGAVITLSLFSCSKEFEESRMKPEVKTNVSANEGDEDNNDDDDEGEVIMSTFKEMLVSSDGPHHMITTCGTPDGNCFPAFIVWGEAPRYKNFIDAINAHKTAPFFQSPDGLALFPALDPVALGQLKSEEVVVFKSPTVSLNGEEYYHAARLDTIQQLNERYPCNANLLSQEEYLVCMKDWMSDIMINNGIILTLRLSVYH